MMRRAFSRLWKLYLCLVRSPLVFLVGPPFLAPTARAWRTTVHAHKNMGNDGRFAVLIIERLYTRVQPGDSVTVIAAMANCTLVICEHAYMLPFGSALCKWCALNTHA